MVASTAPKALVASLLRSVLYCTICTQVCTYVHIHTFCTSHIIVQYVCMEQETDHTDNTMKLYERPQHTGRGRKDYRRQQTQKTGNSPQRHIGIHHMDTSKPPRDCHETEGYCIPQFRKTEGPSRQNTDGATTVHRVQLFAGHSHKACMANSFRECTEVASNKHVYSP